MTAYSPEGKRKLNRNKIQMCLCGRVAVRKMQGGFWSCQPCIDMDPIVWSLHEKAPRKLSCDVVMEP